MKLDQEGRYVKRLCREDSSEPILRDHTHFWATPHDSRGRGSGRSWRRRARARCGSRDISEAKVPRGAGGSRFLACPTEACEGGWYPLPKSSVLMPSTNASRKGQEKPREIVDAAEVGFLLSPRVGECAEGGSGAIRAPLP